MSIQTNFPAIKPTLLLDFANTKQLDSRITFTRASTATYYGTQTAKAEENLVLYSQEFDNAAWTKSNAAISGTNTIVAPDGTTTAEEMRDGTATAGHNAFQAYTVAAGTTYVWSCFLKNVDRQFAILAVSTAAAQYASAKFDLSAGTAGSTATAGAGWSVTSSSITSVGSDWYRCVLVFVAGNSASANARIGTATDGTTFTTNGSGLESYTGTDLKIAMWGAQLEQRSTVTAYTPTTTQTITNYVPQLLTAASGVARFDHNPTTFESLGLEIEESRTNLVTYSEQFNDAAWTKTNATITANTLIAPDGALTGDKIVSNAASLGFTVQNNSQTSGVTYTWSTFAKAAEYSFCQLRITGTVVGAITRAYFNLATGTVSGVANCTASITPVGNGWYRCSIVYAVTSTAVAAPRIYGQVDASDTVGDGYSGIYIWGAQLEAGAFPTSYIPTVASQVTRAADAASMTGTNFSSWYNAAESTFYSDFAFIGLTGLAGQRVFQADDGSNSNYIGTISNSLSAMQNLIIRDGVTEATLSTPTTTFVANTFNKIAAGFAKNNSVSAVNNVLGTTDTSCLLPSGVTSLRFGASITSVNANLLIRKIAYYPLRVTNAQLQALTS